MLTDAQIVLVATGVLVGWAVGVVSTLIVVWPRLVPTRHGNDAVGPRRSCTCEMLAQAATMNTQLYAQNARLAKENIERLGRIRFGDQSPATTEREEAGA